MSNKIKKQMKADIDALNDNDDNVVGYAIVVTRESGGSSMAMQGKINAMLGALEIAKYQLVSKPKGCEE